MPSIQPTYLRSLSLGLGHSLKPNRTREHRTGARARAPRAMPPPLGRARSILLLLHYVVASHLLLCTPIHRAGAATLPDPAPLDPALIFPSATPVQPTAAVPGGTIPAFPEQSDSLAGSSSTCPLAPSPPLLPAVQSSCDADGALPPRLRCCPALAAWLFAAYAPAALAERPPARPAPAAAAVDMPLPPDDSEACAGATDRALRAAGAALPRPPGANGTCDVAFCYCGVRLRRLACGPPPPAEGGLWSPPDAAARKLEKECAQPGVPGCSKCLLALTTIKATNPGGGAGVEASGKKKQQTAGRSTESDRDCELMGLMWLLQRNATRYGATATAVIQALMAVDEASAAGVVAAAADAEPAAACSLPVDDMPLPAEYARHVSRASDNAPRVCCLHLVVLLVVVCFRFVYSL